MSQPLLPLDLPQMEYSPMLPTPRTTDTHAGRGAVQLGNGWYRPSQWLRAGQRVGQANLADVALISSAVGFPARTSASPERVQALRASAAAYGRNTPELLAKFDPDTSSWRTSQLCLDGGLTEFSETWPRSGTMRNGIAYQLPPLVPLTDATASGLLPTPTAVSYGSNQGGGMGRVGPVRHSLDSMARNNLWPTPKSADAERGGRGDLLAWVRGYENKHYPTPTARDYRTGDKPESRRARMKQAGDWHSPNLNDVAAPGGQLNPTWVEWLMGFPLGWTALEPSATQSFRRSRK